MKLKGVNRRAWCENHMVFRRMAPVLANLSPGRHCHPVAERRGPDPAALSRFWAPAHAGSRRSGSGRAGFGRGRAPRSRGLVGETPCPRSHWANFSCRTGTPPISPARRKNALICTGMFFFRPAIAMPTSPSGKRPSRWSLRGSRTRALCPTDQLLHACVHGVVWNPVPPLRWVADASCVLASSDIDWYRMLDLATRFRVVPALRDSLRYLVKTLDAPVPEGVLQRLDSTPVTPVEEHEYQYYLKQLDSPGVSQTVRALYPQYRRTVQGKSWLRRVVSIPLFLQHYWNLDRPRRTISRGFNYGVRRMRQLWSGRRLQAGVL